MGNDSSKNKSVKNITQTIPAKEELDKQFEELMASISMPIKTREKMRVMSDENKWLMICQSKEKTFEKNPSEWLKALHVPLGVKKLRKLRVAIVSAEVEWLEHFVNEKGLQLLLQNNLDTEDDQSKITCLTVLRTFMNSDYGLKAAIREKDIFNNFLSPLQSENDDVLVLLFDQLAVFSWVSNSGRSLVVDLLEKNKTQMNQKSIFSPIIKAIKDKKRDTLTKVSAMTLINALINSILNLEERLFSRQFLLDENILETISGFTQRITESKNKNEDEIILLNQFNIFETEYKNDSKETKLTNIDLSDPQSVWESLFSNSVENATTAYLTDLLKYLLVIPNIRKLSSFLWKNCSYAMRLGTMFVMNDKEVSELEKNIEKIDENVEINEILKRSFTTESRLLKFSEIDKLMSKVVERTKNEDTSLKEHEDLRKEFENYREKKNREIEDLKKQLEGLPKEAKEKEVASKEIGTPPPIAAPPPIDGSAALPVPPPLGDSLPIPPPLSGAIPAPPPIGGGLVPPPLNLSAGAPKVEEYLPKKKNPPPSVKMKIFHWGMIQVNNIKNTVWDKIKDDGIEINTKEFEETFKAHVAAPKTAKLAVDKRKPIKEKEILIDPKRSTNVEIALSRFKMSPESIRDAILTIDEKVLTAETLQKLAALTPTNEEAEVCSSYEGNVADLGNAEKFFRAMAVVPQVSKRLDVLLFRKQFDETYGKLMADIAIVKKGVKEIKENKKLHTVLAVILRMGNHMNGGTKKGGVYGFKLSTLKQLNSTKSNDNKVTLMQYMAREVTRRSDGSHKFVEDLSFLEDAVRIESQDLATKVNKMKGNVNKISDMIKKSPEGGKDRFKPVMQKFYDEAAEKVAKMHMEITSAKKMASELIEMFGENKNRMMWEELFQIFFEFSRSFNEGMLFWKRKKELEDREKKKSLFMKESKERMAAIKSRQKETNGKGGADNVLKNLKNVGPGDIAKEIMRRRRENV